MEHGGESGAQAAGRAIGGLAAGQQAAVQGHRLGRVFDGVHRAQGTVGADSVKIELEDGELRGNVGAQKLTLRGVDRVTGFMGEPIVGWNVVAQQTGEKLVGQLGSTVLGRPFELDLGSAPGWVGTLVAVVAFYALEPRANVTVG